MKIFYLLITSLLFSTSVFSFNTSKSAEFLAMSATISGQVWIDENEDDLLTSETGAAGVLLILNDVNGDPLDTSITIVDGFYEFSEVAAGEYYIEVGTESLELGGALFGTNSCCLLYTSPSPRD